METFFKEMMRNNFEPRFLYLAKIIHMKAKIFQKIHHVHAFSERIIIVCDSTMESQKKMDLGGRRGAMVRGKINKIY